MLASLIHHLLLALAAYLAFSVLVALLMAVIHGLPVKQKVVTSPADLSPRTRALDLEALDGVRLRAYFSPPVGDHPIIVVQAGRRANRDHMLPWCKVLADAGYGILTFDWRAQGESDGWILSYGAHGPKDLLGALRILDELPEARGRPIGIYACSLGAACVAMAAEGLPARVRCLILDSPYGNLARMTKDRLSFLGPLMALPCLMVAVVARVLIGTTPWHIVPEKVLEAFSPRPLLVFHGDADRTVPLREGRSLFDAYPGPKRFWETEGDGHVDARTTRSREWMAQVAAFFEAHLPAAPCAERVLALTPDRIIEPIR